MAPIRTLLFLTLTLAPAAFADFHLEATQNRAEGAVIRLTVVNATPSEAQDVYIVYPSTEAAITQIPSPDWSCTAPSATVNCALTHALAAGQSAILELCVDFGQTAYARKELGIAARGTVEGTVQGSFVVGSAAQYKRFAVTQTGDSGPGSLRAAIEALDADGTCASVPCAIDFAVSGPIRLQSALPQIIAGDVLVAGDVTLDGAAVAGNALDFDVLRRAEVDGLTIASFGDNAILLRLVRRQNAFDQNRLLTVTNCVIENNFRGINVTAGYLAGGSVIRDNVLRFNKRTAIFDGSAHDPAVPLEPVLRIEHNQIIGNGASGIYFGEGSDGAAVVGNVIESNHDFGIGVARGARQVRILPNSIAHNGGAAIDVGLDGPTPLFPAAPVDRNAAVIDSAHYDAATNTTTIAGRPSVTPIVPCDFCGTHLVSLYANDSAEHGQYAEAQTYLGEAKPNGAGFVFTFNGDLRGKYVTALATRWMSLVGSSLYDTDELSKAFLVQ